MTDERKRKTSVGVDLVNNEATVKVLEVKRHQHVSGLFDEDGELRLWEDDLGWTGYVREGDGEYFRVHRHAEKGTLERESVTASEVAKAVREHIRDPLAGGAGRFVRGCSPP